MKPRKTLKPIRFMFAIAILASLFPKAYGALYSDDGDLISIFATIPVRNNEYVCFYSGFFNKPHGVERWIPPFRYKKKLGHKFLEAKKHFLAEHHHSPSSLEALLFMMIKELKSLKNLNQIENIAVPTKSWKNSVKQNLSFRPLARERIFKTSNHIIPRLIDSSPEALRLQVQEIHNNHMFEKRSQKDIREIINLSRNIVKNSDIQCPEWKQEHFRFCEEMTSLLDSGDFGFERGQNTWARHMRLNCL